MRSRDLSDDLVGALRAALLRKEMAPHAMSVLQRHVQAERDRALRLLAVCLAAVIAALALCLSACGCPAPLPPGRTVEAEVASAVTIVVKCDVPGVGSRTRVVGSGVAISPTRVLTAHHVASLVDDLRDEGLECWMHVEDFAGGNHPALVEQWSELDDVARLHLLVPVAWVGSVEIAPTPPPGHRVCAVARFPLPARRCGDVQWQDDPVPSGDPARPGRSGSLAWDGVVEPGNSGGGVYDERGRLVALVTHTVPCPTSFSQRCMGRGTPLAPLAWVAP